MALVFSLLPRQRGGQRPREGELRAAPDRRPFGSPGPAQAGAPPGLLPRGDGGAAGRGSEAEESRGRPGEGERLPAGGGAACACGTGCAGRGPAGGRAPFGLPGPGPGPGRRRARGRVAGRWSAAREGGAHPRRDGGWFREAQPGWAGEAATPPRAGGSGGLRLRALRTPPVEGFRRARALSSGVRGSAVARVSIGRGWKGVDPATTEQPG